MDSLLPTKAVKSRKGNGMASGDFRPISGVDLPRFAGIATFMRLPHVPLDDPRLPEVQIGLIGVPWDGGTTNRPGPRHGPRQLRDNSTMIRFLRDACDNLDFELETGEPGHPDGRDVGERPFAPILLQHRPDRLEMAFGIDHE